MATIPVSANGVTLLSGVPLDIGYEHTRWFKTRSEQVDYFNTFERVKSYSNVSYQREGNINYFRADMNIEQLRKADYLTFRNNDYEGNRFYCFITHLEYLNASTTKVYFEVDVMQTFMFSYKFKQSYVTREHSDQYSDGLPIKSTIDEGLMYGNIMELRKEKRIKTNSQGYTFLVIVCKEDVSMNTPKISPALVGCVQPLTYYIVPYGGPPLTKVYYRPANSTTDGYKTTITKSPSATMTALFTNEDNVNQVVSMYVTDYFGVPFTVSLPDGFDDGESANYQMAEMRFTAPLGSYRMTAVDFSDDPAFSSAGALKIDYLPSFMPMKVPVSSDIYSEFFDSKPQNSKLFSSPYAEIILTNFKGQMYKYNPQEFTDKKVELVIRGSLGTSNKVSYALSPYGMTIGEGISTNLTSLQDHGIIDNTPSDIPILVDTLASYLQGNRNSLMNKKDSILFNGAMGTARGVTGAVGSVATRNVGGAVDGVMGAISSAGNAKLQIEGLLAKQQDINNTPPSIQQGGGNINFDMGNGNFGVVVQFKSATYEYRMILTNYFNMYGYKTMRLKIPKTTTRKYWNYVQLETCNLTSSIAQEYETKIRNIFIKGITLWHTDNMLDYSPTNEVL